MLMMLIYWGGHKYREEKYKKSEILKHTLKFYLPAVLGGIETWSVTSKKEHSLRVS
jgi:hypothetical protein